MAEKPNEMARREERARHSHELLGSPFRVIEQFADEMDRVFDDFGLGRGWIAPRSGSSPWRPLARMTAGNWETFNPDVEIFYRNNELVVRADLPGLAKDDVKVDITEDGVTIQGERKREHQEEHEGIYRSERSYGSFRRMIPIPEGAMTDQAKATFKDGVLEITMPALAEQAKRSRHLDITESSPAKK